MAHVQVKDLLTPDTEKDVRFNVQESIEQTTQIKKVKSAIYIAGIVSQLCVAIILMKCRRRYTLRFAKINCTRIKRSLVK